MRIYRLLIISLAVLSACKPSPVEEKPSPGGDSASGKLPVFYEANPKVFSSGGSIAAIKGRLGAIQALGTDILWLMPIQEFGKEKSVGSPYCIRDYKSVNSSYGTISDVKALVADAHGRGMKVILDWVANHTSWDNAWITDHPDWYTRENGVIISPKGMGWNDVADLDYSSQAMRSAMKDAMLYWVAEADVDGYRCDYADGVPHDFWKDAISTVRGKKKDAIFLAESSNRSYLDDGFDYIYGWPFKSALKALFDGGSATDFVAAVNAESAPLPKGKHVMRFVTNHDQASENSPVSEYRSADGALAAQVISAFSGESSLIYSSQEIAYGRALSFFSVNVMDWNSNPSFTSRLQKVMEAYTSTSSIRSGSPKFYTIGKLVAMYYANGSRGLLVVVNPTGSEVTAKTPMERTGDKMKELVSGVTGPLPASLSLKAYEYLIYEK